METTFDAYLRALKDGDALAALEVVHEAERAGATRETVLRDVVARAQNAVGALWMKGEWGVADEHAATSVAEHVLALFSPPESAREADKLVLLTCAEGEWHTFPPRLAAALARQPGLRVLTLGGSISALHLSHYLANSRPAAVGMSVTLPVNLIGAARSIRAVREAGAAVVVGGAAWGGDQHRARKLGANCYLDDPTQLGTVISDLPEPCPMAELPIISPEVTLLERPLPQLLDDALRRQRAASGWVRTMSYAQEQRTLEDLSWMARHAAAAVLCEDATIMRELFGWLLPLLEPRGVPGSVVLESALHLADAVEHLAPMAVEVLRKEACAAQDNLRQMTERERA